ncbi:CYFIP-related Rac1 interactor B isoform X1 [Myripristis murdjan]|uniref:CYFIP-related Rac1 interactor B isoform X1 n=1 Tax=Myripristis murdjan TaxID=586833 RepID=UPI0011760B60|nr:uncharacterized protein LOC115378610 isoform X1 [Myripristis murdjan]
MAPGAELHISVCREGNLPEPICAGPNRYKCRFCTKVGEYPGLVAHMQTHARSAVKHGGYKIYKCCLGCVKSNHYHCCYCKRIIIRTNLFVNHVEKCGSSVVQRVTTKPQAASLGTNPSTPPSLAAPSSAVSGSSVIYLLIASPSLSGPTPLLALRTCTVPKPSTSLSASCRPSPVPKTGASTCASSSASTAPGVDHSASANQSSLNIEGPGATASSSPLTPPRAEALSPTDITPSDGRDVNVSTISTQTIQTIQTKCPKTCKSKPKLTTCKYCNLTLNKKNIKVHIQRRHSASHPDITANYHLPSVCIDRTKGIFAVGKTFTGPATPIHVQKRTWGSNHQVTCELEKCKQESESSQRSGLMGFQCIHLKSLSYCPISSESEITLNEEVLSDIVRRKLISNNMKKTCLARKLVAGSENSPLSKEVAFGSGTSQVFVSVLEPHASLGRVMVCYDKKKNTWRCPCPKQRRSCPHKPIAKWHLYQTRPELFMRERSPDSDVLDASATSGPHDEQSPEGGSLYSPDEDFSQVLSEDTL